MATWIALFRGINVGGANIVPMQSLKDVLAELGLDAPHIYIQSGNVVFRAAVKSRKRLAASIASAVEAQFGFQPNLLVLTPSDLKAAMARNPYPHAEAEPKSLHLFFITEPLTEPRLDEVDRWRAPEEEFALIDDVAYLHTPNGIGRSKLGARVESLVGSATARNWRTVTKVLAMAEEVAN